MRERGGRQWSRAPAAAGVQPIALLSLLVRLASRLFCLQCFFLSFFFLFNASLQHDTRKFSRSGEAEQWMETRDGGPTHALCSSIAMQHCMWVVSSIYESCGDRRFDTALLHGPDGTLRFYTRKVLGDDQQSIHKDTNAATLWRVDAYSLR